MLKDRYNFVDITIFVQNEDGSYMNITDYTFIGENEKIELNGINSEYVIMLCGFTRRKERYACEITVPELLALADIKNKPFVKQIARGMDTDVARTLIAVMCSEKIKDYAYGRVCRDKEAEGITYNFNRLKLVDKKRTYPTILTKKFRLV